MTVFRREFGKNLVGLIIWGGSIAGLALLMMIASQNSPQAENVSGYPEAFVKALGMDKVDMSSLLGYYAGKASVLVTLFGGIYAALLGSGAVVRDELLLSRPVSREAIVLQRALAAAVNILILNALVAAALFACGAGEITLWIVLAQFLLHMAFAAAALAIAAARVKARAALALPLGIVLVCHSLSMLYAMVDKLDFIKYATPFYYTNIGDIVVSGGMPALNIIAVSAIILVMLALGAGVYRRKDLPA